MHAGMERRKIQSQLRTLRTEIDARCMHPRLQVDYNGHEKHQAIFIFLTISHQVLVRMATPRSYPWLVFAGVTLFRDHLF